MVTEINLGMEEEAKSEIKSKKKDVKNNKTEKIDISKKVFLLEEKIAELEKCILEMASQLNSQNIKEVVIEKEELVSPNTSNDVSDKLDGEDLFKANKVKSEKDVLTLKTSPSSFFGKVTEILFVLGSIIFVVFGTMFFHYLGINYFLSGIISIVPIIILDSAYFISKKKTSVSKPNVEYNCFEFAEITHCPKCNMKLKKSKVINDSNGIMQFLKCNNISCDFQKTISFPTEVIS